MYLHLLWPLDHHRRRRLNNSAMVSVWDWRVHICWLWLYPPLPLCEEAWCHYNKWHDNTKCYQTNNKLLITLKTISLKVTVQISKRRFPTFAIDVGLRLTLCSLLIFSGCIECMMIARSVSQSDTNVPNDPGSASLCGSFGVAFAKLLWSLVAHEYIRINRKTPPYHKVLSWADPLPNAWRNN